MMESDYLWGGTLVGLALLVALGVVLVKNSVEVRETLAQHVGAQAARWLLYGAWFVYGYGLLFAVTQAYLPTLENAGIESPPAAVSFLYGIFGRSLMWFLNAAVPLIQITVLIVACILLFRHLKRAVPGDNKS